MTTAPDSGRTYIVSPGSPTSGVAVFAEDLARSLPGEATVRCVDLQARPLRAALGAAREARTGAGRSCDRVLVQYSPWHWAKGAGLRRLLQVAIFAVAVPGRLFVVPHDTQQRSLRWHVRSDIRLEWLVLCGLVILCKRVIMLSESERRRLGMLRRSRKVRVVPLYVKRLGVTPQASGAGIRLGVVGFLLPRKNPVLAVRVLALLPETASLVFLGGPVPGGEGVVTDITDAAARLSVAARVTVTGYLSEAELLDALGRVDLGLCLYADASASASLVTLLGAGCPVVATRLPVFEEYARSAPRAVRLVDSLEPASVARAVVEATDAGAGQLSGIDPQVTDRGLDAFADSCMAVFTGGRA